jgi:hypothetical protein
MSDLAWLAVRAYLSLQVLLVVAWALCAALHRARLFSPSSMLVLARAFFAAAFLLAAFAHLVPGPSPYRPPVQVWFADGRRGTEAVATLSSPLPGEPGPAVAGVAASPLLLGAGGLAVALAVASVALALRARRRLARVLEGTAPWKRVGRVELRRGTGAGTFAAFLRRRAVVVVDVAATGIDREVALAHELQHHRQGDARLALPLWLALSASAWNPVTRAWRRLFEALEEHACDAAVLSRRRISARDYAECLLRAAAARAAPVPFATSLTMRARRALLTRRILMISRQPTAIRASLRLAAATAAAAMLVVTACASDDLVADHRVSGEQASALARQASSTGFTIVAADVVVEALNRRVGTPDGRAHARGALQRAAPLRAIIDRHLDAHGLPLALAAVPLVESGYDNLPAPSAAELAADKSRFDCAGLWQFIPPTARRYGMRVDRQAGIDDRTDIDKESDAAARLLRDLHAELGDWGLALAAYNQGAKHVHRAIAAEGTRDPWELIRRGAINNYAAEVMAAAIVIAEPSLVGEQ